VAQIREAWKRRDQQAMIDAVSPSMLARMAVAGTPDEARDQLAEFRGWYDRVCCYVPSFGLSGVEIADRIDAAVDTFGATR
jgi:alkanesulfonate monooxygenase SsuD/methylene tetrahydromethanopterin reductase-like flavin-dependent oxidoreductase (luciferase family)